jgi:hypothetical protein
MSNNGQQQSIEAVIYRHSELDKLRNRINELRFATETREYETELKAYNRRRRGRKEITREVQMGDVVKEIWSSPLGGEDKAVSMAGMLGERFSRFPIKRMGRTEFVLRPKKPNRILWDRSRKFFGTGFSEVGLVAGGGRYNRPVSPKRVKEYSDAMVRGQWRDNLIDPIAITSNGEVINGQHRLAAMSQVEREPDEKDDPGFQFLVLFGVPADQVTLSDLSRRSARDFTVIAGKAVA